MNNPFEYIEIAIEEAKKSLREGNSGFGAVVIRDNVLISKAHDTDKVSNDPTAHAEINALRLASRQVRGDFRDCMLVSTHEPCPMCATAVVWAGIKQVAFGFSIQDSIKQGRKRINLTCDELFKRADASIEVICDVKKELCGILYDDQVRKDINQLRGAGPSELAEISEKLRRKRIRWFNKHEFEYDADDVLGAAYQLFLKKLGISAEEAPVVEKQKSRLVIHSRNFCPTLEACKILGLDTRDVCRQLSEGPTQALLQQLHPGLQFKRNYNSLRPFKPYCEEMIVLSNDE